MNILYINTHDTGRYIQPYGHPVPTPNLMKLAGEGMLFRQAYCTAPTCSPSRAGLLTGCMPHNNGMWGLSHRGFALFDTQKHMASFLRGQGYETVLCGIQHESENAASLGYEKILDTQDYAMSHCNRDWRDFDLNNARLTADFLAKRPAGKPFFLAHGIFNTHRRFPEVADSAATGYVMPPSPICDTPENRCDMAAYIESAKIMDDSVGIVLEALTKSEYRNDTLVIFTTDHGIAFPEMKGTLYDTGIGVSLIVRYPGCQQGGVSDALVSHLDLLPTICEYAGISIPDDAQGVSLWPLLRDEAQQVRDCIYAETNFHVTYEPQRCIRTERFKYIRRYSGYRQGMPSNVDDSPDKLRRLREGYYNWEKAPVLLFDLHSDPLERINLADWQAYRQVCTELAEKLDQWLEQTDDPIRKRVMIPPDGAKVNYPDSPSPAEKVFVTDWKELNTRWNGHLFASK